MPHNHAQPYSVRIKVQDRKSLDPELDRATNDAILAALEHRENGILVTRHRDDSFTVELSPDVPFGITLERDLRERSPKRHGLSSEREGLLIHAVETE